jgi:putative SOS response-associated peptidase YedK
VSGKKGGLNTIAYQNALLCQELGVLVDSVGGQERAAYSTSRVKRIPCIENRFFVVSLYTVANITGGDMCGRFVGYRDFEQWARHFPIDVSDAEVTPNYNVAPTQAVFAIVQRGGQNHLEKLHWGLVPFWAKDKAIGNRMINARSETVSDKPSYRTAFRKRRCLILADGFYEWKGSKGKKQPMLLTLPDGSPFAFAGLWESWDRMGKESTPYKSCTILTRAASKSVMPIHNRMPVILKPEAFGPWLNQDNQDVRALQDIIQKQTHTELKSVPVSKQVNSVKVNRPGNLKPI